MGVTEHGRLRRIRLRDGRLRDGRLRDGQRLRDGRSAMRVLGVGWLVVGGEW